MLTTTLLTVLFSTAVLGADPAPRTFAKPIGPMAEATRLLSEGLTAMEKPDTATEQKVAALAKTCQAVIVHVTPQSPVGQQLTTAIETTKQLSAEQAAAALAKAAREARATLEFQPRHEADLPQGFPTYTPVGAIELKRYPAYRLAQGGSFWTLFSHIQRNGVAMTAPVKMEYEKNEQGQLAEKSMAFLYGIPTLGAIGKQGAVEVVDAPAETVVSLGMRGLRTQASLSDACERLSKWIEAHPRYDATGGPRVMGYNSPFNALNKQFFEVQIPLREKKTGS